MIPDYHQKHDLVQFQKHHSDSTLSQRKKLKIKPFDYGTLNRIILLHSIDTIIVRRYVFHLKIAKII